MPDDQVAAEPSPPSFGSELRTQREIRGISLREISDSTKISKRFLEAMEQDAFRALPAPVFTRGFIREYARYLGLSSDEMITRYEDYLRSTEGADPDVPRPLVSGSIPSVSRKSNMERSRIPALVLALLAGAAIASLVIYVARRPRLRAPASAVTASAMAPSMAMHTETAAPAVTPAPGGGVVMKIRARESSWIALDIDGVAEPEYEMHSGEEKTYRAREKFEFKIIGNAGGIDLTVNGRTLSPLGPSGKVLHGFVVDGNGPVPSRSR